MFCIVCKNDFHTDDVAVTFSERQGECICVRCYHHILEEPDVPAISKEVRAVLEQLSPIG